MLIRKGKIIEISPLSLTKAHTEIWYIKRFWNELVVKATTVQRTQCLVSVLWALHWVWSIPYLRHIVASAISVSVNAYVLPVAVIGETVERIAAWGTMRTSYFLGNEKVAGPDGCKNFTLISFVAWNCSRTYASHHLPSYSHVMYPFIFSHSNNSKILLKVLLINCRVCLICFRLLSSNL